MERVDKKVGIAADSQYPTDPSRAVTLLQLHWIRLISNVMGGVYKHDERIQYGYKARNLLAIPGLLDQIPGHDPDLGAHCSA